MCRILYVKLLIMPILGVQFLQNKIFFYVFYFIMGCVNLTI